MRTLLCFALLCSSAYGQVFDFTGTVYCGTNCTESVAGVLDMESNEYRLSLGGDGIGIERVFVAPPQVRQQLDSSVDYVWLRGQVGDVYATANVQGYSLLSGDGQPSVRRAYFTLVDGDWFGYGRIDSFVLQSTVQTAAVPEPSSWMLAALIALPWIRRLWM